MSCLSSYAAIAVTVVASTLASPAFANVITFETAPFGSLTGPVTENGFTYSTLSGNLEVDALGNPGHDMAGTGGLVLGGVLKIVSATGGDFTFDDIDFAAFASSGTGSQTLEVKGLLAGSTVGLDTYTLTNTSNRPYTNWTTELASVLAGKTLSELDITLNAGSLFSESIDNVVLTPVPARPIGRGLPVLLAIGGVLFGAKLLERSKRDRLQLG